MSGDKAVRWIVLSAILFLYILFRFWKLTDSCLWFDEIFSVHAAEHDWNSLIRFVAADLIHPPLFYLLLKLWISIGGESLLWLRLFPLLVSLVSVAPLLLVCREWKMTGMATAISLGLTAINGTLIKYSQEVRMYSLLMFLSTASIWLFARYFNRGKGIVALTATNLLLVYTHYFGWFVIVSELIAIAWYQRIKLRVIVVSTLLVVLGFLPWAALIAVQLDRGADIYQNIGWMERPGLRAVVQLTFNAIEPFYYQSSTVDPATMWFISLPLIMLFSVAAAIYSIEKRKHRTEFLLLIFVVVPVLLAFGISWLMPLSVWGTRHLVIVIVPLLLIFSRSLSQVTFFKVRTALVSMLVLISLAGFYVELQRPRQEFIWCAWSELGKKLPVDTPQTVYAFEDLSAYHLWFSVRNDQNVSVVKVNGVPEMTEDAAYFLPRGFDGVHKIEADEMKGDHFWVAFRDMKWNDRHPPISELIAQGYKLSPPIEVDAQGMKAFLVEAHR